MAQCSAVKPNGHRCTILVGDKQTFCWAHDPAHAEQRRQRASKGGKAKPNREIKDIKSLCRDLTERVLCGELQPGPAAVANQLINTRLRAIEQERKVKETDELLARVEALEAQRAGVKRHWG